MATREQEDDGVSFSSDITIDPETYSTEVPGPRQAHWSPDVHESRSTRPVNSDSQGGNVNSNTQEDSAGQEDLWVKILKLVLELVPSVSLTCAVQLMKVMDGVSLYLIGLVLFQAIFWPSMGYVIYARFVKKVQIFEPISSFAGGHWANLFMLQVHAIVMAVNVLLLLKSIQYLDITVALALTFLPCLVIILMEHILAQKSCSVELVATLVTGYIGVIILTISALLHKNPTLERDHYNGIAASVGSSLLTVQASFILKYLKCRKMDESLVLTSSGFQGSLICVIIGASTQFLSPITSVNAGFIAAICVLSSLAAILVVFKLTSGNIRQICTRPVTTGEHADGQASNENSRVPTYTSMTRLRTYIFILSCTWAFFRQLYKHQIPTVFSILGVLLVVGSFLFAMAYKEWYAIVHNRRQNIPLDNNENRPKNTRPFQFVPWLFSREPIMYIH